MRSKSKSIKSCYISLCKYMSLKHCMYIPLTMGTRIHSFVTTGLLVLASAAARWCCFWLFIYCFMASATYSTTTSTTWFFVSLTKQKWCINWEASVFSSNFFERLLDFLSRITVSRFIVSRKDYLNFRALILKTRHSKKTRVWWSVVAGRPLLC